LWGEGTILFLNDGKRGVSVCLLTISYLASGSMERGGKKPKNSWGKWEKKQRL